MKPVVVTAPSNCSWRPYHLCSLLAPLHAGIYSSSTCFVQNDKYFSRHSSNTPHLRFMDLARNEKQIKVSRFGIKESTRRARVGNLVSGLKIYMSIIETWYIFNVTISLFQMQNSTYIFSRSRQSTVLNRAASTRSRIAGTKIVVAISSK